MGADGHIYIYDREKLKQTFSEEDIKLFDEHILGCTAYLQKMNDKEYITRYTGSNLDGIIDAYETFSHRYNVEKDVFDGEPLWYRDRYREEFYMKELTKKQRQKLFEMVAFMQMGAFITSWEVWT